MFRGISLSRRECSALRKLGFEKLYFLRAGEFRRMQHCLYEMTLCIGIRCGQIPGLARFADYPYPLIELLAATLEACKLLDPLTGPVQHVLPCSRGELHVAAAKYIIFNLQDNPHVRHIPVAALLLDAKLLQPGAAGSITDLGLDTEDECRLAEILANEAQLATLSIEKLDSGKALHAGTRYVLVSILVRALALAGNNP